MERIGNQSVFQAECGSKPRERAVDAIGPQKRLSRFLVGSMFRASNNVKLKNGWSANKTHRVGVKRAEPVEGIAPRGVI